MALLGWRRGTGSDMAAGVGRTGREIKALRKARRLGVSAFAQQLGVSDRMVSKWEAGGELIRPRTGNQQALDAFFAMADAEVRARFEALVADSVVPVPALALTAGAQLVLRHPVDGKVMTLIEEGPYRRADGEPLWLTGFFIDMAPTTHEQYDEFARATGHPPADQRGGGDGLVKVSRLDAQSYCVWAGKALPTAAQLQRAAAGDEGVILADVTTEWCGLDGAARRTTVARGPANFRTVTPSTDLLTLLSI
jgi:formylglycine-generating enzyme required for sulfatase activity